MNRSDILLYQAGKISINDIRKKEEEMRDPIEDPQPGDCIQALMPTTERRKYPSGFMNVYRRVTSREGDLVSFRARGNAHTTYLPSWKSWAKENNAQVSWAAK